MKKKSLSISGISRRHACVGVLGALLCSATRLGANTGATPATKTIEHLFGKTEVPQNPQRIVALGWNCEDILLALGQMPVAMEFRGLFDSGILPWNEALLSDDRPVILQNGMADYEQIASLNPDLIIVLSEYMEFGENSFKRLQQIAPTIVHQSKEANLVWKEQTQFVADAIGKSDQADRLIVQTEDFLNNLTVKYPKTRDKTFIFGTYAAGRAELAIYLPMDPRVAMLENIGMKLADGVRELGEQNPNQWRAGISLENIDMMDSDVAIIGYGYDTREAVESSPLLRQHRAIRDGHCVYIEDADLTWGSSALSVLSIPFAFETFVRRISASLDNG